MRRAGQTPHGAKPNREGFSGQTFGDAGNACRLGAPQPPGRSLEPRSNAWPRGMTVPPQGGQNSAYRSGWHKFLPNREGPPTVIPSNVGQPAVIALRSLVSPIPPLQPALQNESHRQY